MASPFRCREFASIGRASSEYRTVKSRLPSENVLHAQFRDSKGSWFVNRLKGIPGIVGDDRYADACSLGIATCRWSRFLNDSKGSEFLSAGVLLSLLELRGIWQLEPGDPMVGFATGLRRTAEYLWSLRTSKRPLNSDRINVTDCVLFDALWHESETTDIFLQILATCQAREDVCESAKRLLAGRAIRYANERLDAIDQAVFGGIVPHADYVFGKIIVFWQELGLEWLVAREALQEFRPDSLTS